MAKLNAYVLLVLVALVMPHTVSLAEDRDTTGTIEGDVLKIDANSIVVKNHKDGSEVSLPVGRQTNMGGEFKPGDKVEIMVTPQGVVTSVQPLTGGLRR
jgi:bifunctional DNA-binding transcriptional regulator/antitoxin component of YhaV-PrlF toxin-antitoxin module